tara:strand:- start:3304 stop:4935 length:1632 start_codon:yes stop_codon:yes gene_type:complete
MKQPDFFCFFPYERIREPQQQAVDFALNSFINEKKRFVIIEAGTGVGKSAIGLTVARYLNSKLDPNLPEFVKGSYFVTTQKILQEQYIQDFGPPSGGMQSIKSSSNYMCKYHKRNTCQQSQHLLRTSDRSGQFYKTCSFRCTYKQLKQKFLESKESVTNFPYLLTESNFAGKITPRNVLIVDEAHRVESELSKFIEVKISERYVTGNLDLSWPSDIRTQHKAYCWIRDTYYPKVKVLLDHQQGMMSKFTSVEKKMKEFASFAKQFDILKGHVGRLKTFLGVYSKDNWVFEYIPAEGRSKSKFSFRVIDVSPFSEDYLFRLGHRVLLMSATILDHSAFCRSLGISPSEVSFLRLSSPFPTENRPICFAGVGSMNASNISNTLPKMKEMVREILNQHPNEKGIIHCHTFRIARFLKSNLKDPRLLIHDSENRDEILKKHIKSKKPTVLLSPSMSEGVDLKNDLSRFQIVCKVPYPYYGDPLIRKRMNKWKWWYPLQTAKLIVQSVGRSVRNMEDHAVTYILDSDWETFFRRNKDMFPEDFKSCLQ